MSRRTEAPAPQRLEDLEPPVRRRLIAKTALVALALVALVLVVYFSVPWDGDQLGDIVGRLVISLGAVVVGVVVSVQFVLRAEYPMLRAYEVLGAVIAIAIAAFASAYAYLSHLDADSFTETLTRTDALYFAITTSATVGYGDISPSSEAARVIVMVHMIMNVVVLGVAARALVYAARKRVDRL